MQIARTHLEEAAVRGLLRHDQVSALWGFLADRQHGTPSFRAAHILYYLGGLVAIGAMSLFMTLGWENFGAGGLLGIAALYAVLAVLLTEWLLQRRQLELPAGVTAALAIVMAPLAVYAAQHLIGLWPESRPGEASVYRDYHTRIDWRWFFMELATLAAGAVALWRYRLPFMVLPLAVTLWYMSMDLSPLLFDGQAHEFFSDRGKLVSTVFGVGMIGAAFVVDLRTIRSKDFAFWLYVFGVLAFWGGLTSMNSNSELGKLIYCAINLLMIAVGAALSRRVFAVFGGIGVALYLGHLSHTVFKDSMLFPVALTAIGLGIVAAGVVWQRHEARIGAALRAPLPQRLRELVEHRSMH